ncbi:MAG: tetratricopeptide repeat protein [Deltaproteobacteria bacterium]|nr:tetratricopeptide repeat protein [Deltaproteobacteria bacterium]
MIKKKDISCSRIIFAFTLLFVLILLVYSNTFYASWHMDDFHNIVYNPGLHIKDLQPSSLIGSFFSLLGQSNELYRPLPCLTFAINWYLGKENVVGYHMVNITIHFLTAFFLFLTVCHILRLPNLKGRYHGNEYFIALLAATLWAINPIQTQAVTYIVQRMASLSTMFYILSIFLYIKGRMENSFFKKSILFFACLLSFILALASKENAATLPFALILVEIIFFQDLNQVKSKKTFGLAFLIGVLLLAGIALFFMHGKPLSFLEEYEKRPFTLWQRLMTEPRVLVFYLSQIFYPVPTRLSIEHDFSISTSLIDPWTTLLSIVFVLLLIALGLSQIKKRQILCFGLLFFFLNHLIESSIISLELVFEHRNYLPSLFLFFPVSVIISWLINNYFGVNRFMFFVLVFFVILLIIGLGSGTYVRNMAWATEKTLWEDAMIKAPESGRPPHNLAWGYYDVSGIYDRAMELYKRSFPLKWSARHYKADALYGMGGIYYKKGEYEKAVKLYKEALKINPKDEMAHRQFTLSLIKLGIWDKALEEIDLLLLLRPDNVENLNLKGFILLKQKKLKDAIFYFTTCLKQSPNSRKPMTNIGVTLGCMGEYERAEWFLRSVNARHPKDIITLLWLIETNLRTGDKEDADRYMDNLFASVQAGQFVSTLKRLFEGNLVVPIPQKLLIGSIAKKLKEKSEQIVQHKAPQSGQPG